MQNSGLVRSKLKTPRAAAIAGIVFLFYLLPRSRCCEWSYPAILPILENGLKQIRGLSVLRSILSHSPELHFFGLLARCATGLASTKTAFLLRFFWAVAWCF